MWTDAHEYLSALSSPLGSLATDQGLLELEGSTNHFAHLVRAIVGQQLSTSAAATIGGRVLEAVGGAPRAAARRTRTAGITGARGRRWRVRRVAHGLEELVRDARHRLFLV